MPQDLDSLKPHGSTLSALRLRPDEIALEPGKFVTFLKAFRTAPGWTDAELHIFKECLEEGGFKVKRIPSLVDKKRKRQRK